MDKIINALKKIIKDYGFSILNNPQRINALLYDYHPLEKKMRYLIELSLRSEIPNRILQFRNESTNIYELKMSELKLAFKDDYLVEDKAIESIFNCWSKIFPALNEKVFIGLPEKNNESSISTQKKDKILRKKKKIRDIDGNEYTPIRIGNQVWLLENLQTMHYQNGDLIETVSSIDEKISIEKRKYQWVFSGYEDKIKQFGRLYTWPAVNDNRNISPDGFRVASDDDWLILEKYLLNKSNFVFCEDAFMNCDENLWHPSIWKKDSNIENRNKIDSNKDFRKGLKINLYPAGYRQITGEFIGAFNTAAFWTSTESAANSAYYRSVSFFSSLLFRNSSIKSLGLSVRCIKIK